MNPHDSRSAHTRDPDGSADVGGAGAPSWPRIGVLVTIEGPRWPVRTTRVEDVDGDHLAVADPSSPHGEPEPPQQGDPFTLTWAGPRGLQVLKVALRARVRDGVPLWWLLPTGAVQTHQRRQFVRAPVAGPWPVRVELVWEAPEHGAAQGYLVDLSEGGLRARLRGWTAPDGAAVAVRLTLVEARAGARAGARTQVRARTPPPTASRSRSTSSWARRCARCPRPAGPAAARPTRT